MTRSTALSRSPWDRDGSMGSQTCRKNSIAAASLASSAGSTSQLLRDQPAASVRYGDGVRRLRYQRTLTPPSCIMHGVVNGDGDRGMACHFESASAVMRGRTGTDGESPGGRAGVMCAVWPELGSRKGGGTMPSVGTDDDSSTDKQHCYLLIAAAIPRKRAALLSF